MSMWLIRSCTCLLYLSMSCVSTLTLFNAAPNKTCSQSTNYINGGIELVASNAIDDDVGHDIAQCASTGHYDGTPWWRIDLEVNYIIHSVRVRNRNANGYRLHDFTVWVSTDDVSNGSICTTREGVVPDGAVETLICDPIAFGRFVKITKPTNDFADILTLCEVQVIVVDRTRLMFERQVQKTIDAEFQAETSAPNVASCCQMCHQDPSCSAFGFNPSVDLCQLYNSTRTSDASNDGWRFYVFM